jgi:hypothetical protein
VLIRRCAHIVLVAVALAACGEQRSDDGSHGVAVAACRDLLGKVVDSERLATTVREEEPGFLIRAWSSGRAEGQPDYLCHVARDESAERGVRVVKLQSRDGSGAFRSSLDIDFDDAWVPSASGSPAAVNDAEPVFCSVLAPS